MIIIKFIRWWWSVLDYGDRMTLSICSGLVTSLLGLLIFGLKFLLFTMLALVAGVLIWGSVKIVIAIRAQWRYFKQLEEQEAQRIICRLKGIR